MEIRGFKIKTIVTVGDGIAAWCLHHALKNKSDLQIINLSANGFFTPCSMRTTSINCLRGTREGVSKLGDTIRRGWFFFEEFNQKYQPAGVVPGYEYQILENATLEKWERRYPSFQAVASDSFLKKLIKNKNLFHNVPAYFINPAQLKEWLHLDITNIDYRQALVQEIVQEKNCYRVRTQKGIIDADYVVLCTNHLTPLLAQNVNEDFLFYLNHSKPVAGSYLELNQAANFGFKWNHSFNLAIEKYHFIYRHTQDQIQIGATSDNRDTCEIPKQKQLQEIYHFIDQYTQFDLPAYSHFEQLCGIRFKGHYRLPYWGNIDDQKLFAICGLYKNAFTYGFVAAHDIASAIAAN